MYYPPNSHFYSRSFVIKFPDSGVTPHLIRSRDVDDLPNSHFCSRFSLSSIRLLEVCRSWRIKPAGTVVLVDWVLDLETCTCISEGCRCSYHGTCISDFLVFKSGDQPMWELNRVKTVVKLFKIAELVIYFRPLTVGRWRLLVD